MRRKVDFAMVALRTSYIELWTGLPLAQKGWERLVGPQASEWRH